MTPDVSFRNAIVGHSVKKKFCCILVLALKLRSLWSDATNRELWLEPWSKKSRLNYGLPAGCAVSAEILNSNGNLTLLFLQSETTRALLFPIHKIGSRFRYVVFFFHLWKNSEVFVIIIGFIFNRTIEGNKINKTLQV